jgi:pyridoxal phosphate enzyme (YggS family)
MEVVVGARPTGTPNSLVDRIAVLREQLADACRSAGREPSSVRLVAVTKSQPREAVLAAITAGVEDVAENYAQEAQSKLAGIATVRKHFIGHVQTNKAKAIVKAFDVVQSIDRIEAGRAIAKAARALHKPVKALVQVNVSPTERFGAAPDEAFELAQRLRAEGLDVEGVMAIGPLDADDATIRDAFRVAAGVFERVGGSTLSLGMSGDWREAIACGSTMVRLGTAIFGPRGAPSQAEGLFV